MTNKNSPRTPGKLLVTTKFRDLLARELSDPLVLENLVLAPKIKGRYVLLDLSDNAFRKALSRALQPWKSLSGKMPPALVGSARKVDCSINSYESRIANYDLFEDSAL